MEGVQIHPLSDVKATSIGLGTRIWQYCVIFPNATIGAGCNICAHVLIENDVVVGDNVTIKSGVQLWDGLRLGNDVFVGPNVTFTNDKFPRSKRYPDHFLKTLVGAGVSIGANATILPGIKIGSGAMIGAGTVVTKDVPTNAIVTGNPGVITGYVDATTNAIADVVADQKLGGASIVNLGVGGCTLHKLPLVPDMRGSLSVVEFEDELPFVPKRCFWVFDVPSREVRGEHAHKTLHEFLVCVKGSISVVLDDGNSRTEVSLNQPNIGLHIPPQVWRIHFKYSDDAMLLVFASTPYDASDYLRNYDDFLAYIDAGRQVK